MVFLQLDSVAMLPDFSKCESSVYGGCCKSDTLHLKNFEGGVFISRLYKIKKHKALTVRNGLLCVFCSNISCSH